MFGYVRPYKDELRVREYEQYKAIYCGLCRALGKNYGVLSRLTLSYDCTLFAAAAIGRLAQAQLVGTVKGDLGGREICRQTDHNKNYDVRPPHMGKMLCKAHTPTSSADSSVFMAARASSSRT